MLKEINSIFSHFNRKIFFETQLFWVTTAGSECTKIVSQWTTEFHIPFYARTQGPCIRPPVSPCLVCLFVPALALPCFRHSRISRPQTHCCFVTGPTPPVVLLGEKAAGSWQDGFSGFCELTNTVRIQLAGKVTCGMLDSAFRSAATRNGGVLEWPPLQRWGRKDGQCKEERKRCIISPIGCQTTAPFLAARSTLYFKHFNKQLCPSSCALFFFVGLAAALK